MTQNYETNQTAQAATSPKKFGEYAMIVSVVVALGISMSFQLAVAFSTCLGALVALAAIGSNLLGSPGDASKGRADSRLLRTTDEEATAKS